MACCSWDLGRARRPRCCSRCRPSACLRWPWWPRRSACACLLSSPVASWVSACWPACWRSHWVSETAPKPPEGVDMIGYATLGTNNLERAAAFYDALLAEMGARRLWVYDRGIGWGTPDDQPSPRTLRPDDRKPAA